MSHNLPVPLCNRILISCEVQEKEGGLYLNPHKTAKPNMGKVLAVGPLCQLPVSVGNTIVFDWFEVDKVGEYYTVIGDEIHVLAVIGELAALSAPRHDTDNRAPEPLGKYLAGPRKVWVQLCNEIDAGGGITLHRGFGTDYDPRKAINHKESVCNLAIVASVGPACAIEVHNGQKVWVRNRAGHEQRIEGKLYQVYNEWEAVAKEE